VTRCILCWSKAAHDFHGLVLCEKHYANLLRAASFDTDAGIEQHEERLHAREMRDAEAGWLASRGVR